MLVDNISEPEFEDAHGSKWIIGIDHEGNLFVVVAPNIHPSFFDDGMSAEELRLPFDNFKQVSGVYEIICDLVSNDIDEYEFEISKITPIYTEFNLQ